MDNNVPLLNSDIIDWSIEAACTTSTLWERHIGSMHMCNPAVFMSKGIFVASVKYLELIIHFWALHSNMENRKSSKTLDFLFYTVLGQHWTKSTIYQRNLENDWANPVFKVKVTYIY